MAFSYFNPNPRGRKTGDCAVRAIAKALNISWESAYIDLTMEGYNLADMPSSNLVIDRYLKSKGFRKHAIPDNCIDCYTFADFMGEFFKGTFVLGTGTHLACVIDSTLYDSWDSSDCVPIYYYEKEN